MTKRKRAKQAREVRARNLYLMAAYDEQSRRVFDIWKQNFVQFDVNYWRSRRDDEHQT